MPLSPIAKRDMTPVRQKFCDDVRALYVERYKVPCLTADADIIKLALGYRFVRATDKEISFLLQDMHDTNTGAEAIRLQQEYPTIKYNSLE